MLKNQMQVQLEYQTIGGKKKNRAETTYKDTLFRNFQTGKRIEQQI